MSDELFYGDGEEKPRPISPEMKRLIEATQIRLTEYIPHVPHPKQHAFLWLETFEALFGGAAGGGKSDALLMAALQYVDIPGYSAILFRKTMPELRLPSSLIPRSKEWLDATPATWNDNNREWTFPSGATLSFGFMKSDDDANRYQSAEFQFVGFDELTHFTEYQYTYMMSRIRRPKDLDRDNMLSKVPLRIRSATNPGGRGHLWVKRRFIAKETKTKEGRWHKQSPDEARERIFIPSFLEDNPSLDQESYEFALEQTDEETRQQLLLGNWDARAKGTWVIRDQTYLEASMALAEEMWEAGVPELPRPGKKINVDVISIDWGEITQSYSLWPLADGGFFVPPSEIIGEHEDPVDVTIRILEKARSLQTSHGRNLIRRANYDAAGVQSMRTFVATARKQPGYEQMRAMMVPFQKYKMEALGYLRLLLQRTAHGKATRIIAIHPGNVELVRQLGTWKFKTVSDVESEQIEKQDDHGPDSLLAGIAPTASAHRAYIDKMLQKAKEKKDNG